MWIAVRESGRCGELWRSVAQPVRRRISKRTRVGRCSHNRFERPAGRWNLCAIPNKGCTLALAPCLDPQPARRFSCVRPMPIRKAAMAVLPDPRKNHLLAALPLAHLQRWLPQLEPVTMPLGHVLYESGAHAEPCVLPHHGHRLAAVRDGERRVGRDRGGRQRGHRRHLAVHGRRVDAQPGGGAERWPRASA